MYSQEKIDKIIEEGLIKVRWNSKQPIELYQPLQYTIELGGKRLRPRFCLTVYNLFQEKIEESVLRPALALEIFHSFTLIHDDIMDKASLRRGKPTVYKKWNSNVAILSGDAMCIASYALLAVAPANKLSQILQLFSKTALGVCEGQQFDMNFEKAGSVSMEDYMNMVGLKTGVLIACAAEMGAILGGASEKLCRQIYDFGFRLGVAFQIQDDYLDSFGDEAVFGKKIGGDILNNKKTWLLIKCKNIATKAQLSELECLMKMKATVEKIEAVKKFYKRLKINTLAQKAINEDYNSALEILNEMKLSTEQKNRLKEFAQTLIKREK